MEGRLCPKKAIMARNNHERSLDLRTDYALIAIGTAAAVIALAYLLLT
jgi:hypothetical protein